MINDTTILLVGHGSRGREGNKETINFAAQWRELHPDWRIEVCFIEHAEVLLEEAEREEETEVIGSNANIDILVIDPASLLRKEAKEAKK